MTRYLLFLLFLWLTVPMQAQIDSLETEEYTEDAELQEDEPAVPYKAPPIAPVAMREIKEDDWENAAKNLPFCGQAGGCRSC